MNILWGSIMASIGAIFALCAIVSLIIRKDVPIYHFLAEKSRLLWRGFTHYFYMIVGIVILVLGILFALGIIWH